MNIRKATLHDVETLSALASQTFAEAFGHSMSQADLAAHLEKHLSPQCFKRMVEEDTVLEAEVDGRVIGYAQFGAAAGGSSWELRRLYVLRDFQNQGTGSRLMESALAHPGMQAAEHITLDVWEHNPAARRLYERYGFAVVGARRFTVESGVETSLDLLMVRPRRAPSKPGTIHNA